MLRVRLPKVSFKLGFLKKLLHKRSEPEAVVVESTATDTELYQKRDEKTTAAFEEPLEECPICHDPVGLENPEGIMESWVHLHCNHKFGTHCIQTWLQESAQRDPYSMPCCPICRNAAEHPCGHPVMVPISRSTPYPLWSNPPSTTPPTAYSSYAPHSRRPRRRLSRRWGHPRRPTPPQPGGPNVQVVGKCNTCAVNAAQENIMRQMTTPSIEASETTYGGRARNSDRDRRTVLKSMLMQTSLRRSGNSAAEPARTDNYPTQLEPLSGHSTPPLVGSGTQREYVTQCRTRAAVSHTPAAPGVPMGL
ncbi:hypothetical protein GGR50DRAFT_691067 [Xylaria sp. CBS 124048]|nr:hypothetical protein GGR50DRAFT_691067 [Xylaria sp. CBS 124048]